MCRTPSVLFWATPGSVRKAGVFAPQLQQGARETQRTPCRDLCGSQNHASQRGPCLILEPVTVPPYMAHADMKGREQRSVSWIIQVRSL